MDSTQTKNKTSKEIDECKGCLMWKSMKHSHLFLSSSLCMSARFFMACANMKASQEFSFGSVFIGHVETKEYCSQWQR